MDKKYIIEMIRKADSIAKFAKHYGKDPEIALVCASIDGLSIAYFNASVFKDPVVGNAIYYAALANNPLALQWMPPYMKDYKALVMSLLVREPMVLEFASNRLRQDRDVTKLAIDMNHEARRFAFKSVRDVIP